MTILQFFFQQSPSHPSCWWIDTPPEKLLPLESPLTGSSGIKGQTQSGGCRKGKEIP